MDMDLFESEQRIHDKAIYRIEDVSKGVTFDFNEYVKLVKEYGKLLKQLRRATRLADRTMSGQHESNLELIGKANYDVLTGIYNRRYMEDSLRRLINFMTRGGGGQLSVMMIDVDNFKKFNDTYGHALGDACLKIVAMAISGSLTRADDFAVRYGGEEFAVILPNTDEAGACRMAGVILENVKAKEIMHSKNGPGVVTVSIGVTTGQVIHPQDGPEYIKRADRALYMSKMNGRNRYTYINFKEEPT